MIFQSQGGVFFLSMWSHCADCICSWLTFSQNLSLTTFKCGVADLIAV